jgi:hypothetical protein
VYIEGYSWKAEPLQERKILLLKNIPTKGTPRKRFAVRMALEKPSGELEAFNQLQKEFSSTKFLFYHNPMKQLYTDMDSSKERGHGAIVYYPRDDYVHPALSKPSPWQAPSLTLFRALKRKRRLWT